MYRLNEEIVLELIDETSGNVSAIARACQVCRSSVISFIERRPHLLQAVRDARAAMLDEARSQLAKQVAQGKQWAIKHALKSAGPDEFARHNDRPGPQLTNAERLELLQELVESIKKEQAQAAASESTGTTTPRDPGATGQQAPTYDNTLQQRHAPGAAPRASATCSPTGAPAQHQSLPRKPPTAQELRRHWFPDGEVPIISEPHQPELVASSDKHAPEQQCPTDDDNILQRYAPVVAPRAAEARGHESEREGRADSASPDNHQPGRRRPTDDDSIRQRHAPPVAPGSAEARGHENEREFLAAGERQRGQIALFRATIPR